MKKGWEYIALSSVCRVQNGFAFNSKLFNDSNNGLPLIRIRDIKRGYSLTYTDEICSEDFFVEDGDMLIGMDGDFNIGEWKGGHALLNQRVCKLIPSEKVLAKFIFYFIPEALQKINDKTAFSTVKHLSSKQVNTILLPNLALSEQQSIVDYLDSAFAKIDAMKANAEKALNEAKALFQASLKEMLEPKEGWEEKKLGDIAEDSADGPFGSNLKKEHYTTEKEVRIIQLSNIGEDGWREENTKYTTFEHLKNISRSEVEPNDIVIAKMMPAGRAILCPSHEPKFVLSSDAVKIKLKKGMETRFILHSINSPYFRNEVYENVTGSGRVRTSLTKLRACSIFLPSLSEQQSIVTTLDSLKSKVDRLQENYEKISQECDALKQAILRQVFE